MIMIPIGINIDNWSLRQIFSRKIVFKLISTNFLLEKNMSKINTKSMKTKLLKT